MCVCVCPPRSRHADRIRCVRDLFGELHVKDGDKGEPEESFQTASRSATMERGGERK